MPQTGQRVVAPTDPNPQWPAGYVAALREAGAQEKTIPYYITWVRRFFGYYPGRRRRELGRTEIETFLEVAAARPDVTNWQVQRARDSLELYYERFRGIALAPRTDIPKSHAMSAPAMQPDAPTSGAHTAPASLQMPQPLSKYASRVGDVNNESNTANGRFGNGEKTRQTVREDARPPIPAQRVVPAIEGQRLREPPSPGMEPGAPSGSVDWRALDAKVRECLRIEHYSYRTEQTYVGWIRRFVIFHKWRKPSSMEAKDVHEFLRYLAMDEQVAAFTQNQAA